MINGKFVVDATVHPFDCSQENWGDGYKQVLGGFHHHRLYNKVVEATEPDHPSQGRTFSLGQDIQAAGVPMARDGIRGFHLRPAHFMMYGGGDEVSGCSASGDNCFSAEDCIGLRIHGVTTRADAFCHGWMDETLYDGCSRNAINGFGVGKLGIQSATNFVTRGVLFDVARARGVRSPSIDDRVSVEDLVDCGAPALEPGDVALLRTGWRNIFYDHAENYGMHILELLDLEEPSEAGAGGFLFGMAPLRITAPRAARSIPSPSSSRS
ncbi:cyclase family protein [Streptomyces sp. NPDC001978]|uniref:cyclase family protein n=1 Tax=Streptomyces sp. NPDC001978 TaxID=3364627 RepID=UPI0036C649C3